MTIKEIKDRAAEYFSTKPEIKLAYLFGSQAKSKTSKLSDIDIAAYLSEKIAEQKDVVCVYLFGSAAAGKENKFSDVDIGILFDDSLGRQEYSRRILAIMDGLSEALDKDVDAIALNTADSFMKFRIIKTGIRIYERPDRAGRSFEARSIIEYFDFSPIRERLEKALINSIRRA